MVFIWRILVQFVACYFVQMVFRHLFSRNNFLLNYAALHSPLDTFYPDMNSYSNVLWNDIERLRNSPHCQGIQFPRNIPRREGERIRFPNSQAEEDVNCMKEFQSFVKLKLKIIKQADK